jgi:hypothetical protein
MKSKNRANTEQEGKSGRRDEDKNREQGGTKRKKETENE